MLFKVNLVMVLVFEEKEKTVNLLVNPRKPVEKAMQVCWEVSIYTGLLND